MPDATKFDMIIKTETLLSVTGFVWTLAVFVVEWKLLQVSSPLALLIICAAGFIISFRYKLTGGIFLFSGGLALAVHPFMFNASYWLVPGAALIGLAGFILLIAWWRKNGN
jgi:hypothetical protein